MKYNSPIHSSPPPETQGREIQKKYLRKDGSEGSEGTDGACKMLAPLTAPLRTSNAGF